MQEMGISTGVISSNHQQGCKVDESPNGTSELSGGSGLSCQMEGAQSNTVSMVDTVDYQMKVDNVHDNSSMGKSEDAVSRLLMENADAKQPIATIDDLIRSRKRQKLDEPQVELSVAVEATENSVLNWLKNFEDGVSFWPTKDEITMMYFIPLT